MSTPRRSSVVSLRTLPEVFSFSDVEHSMECSRNAAAVYCTRWRSMGLAELVSERGGVHFNLVVNTNAPQDSLYPAMTKVVGGKLVEVGATALNAHEWTNQIARKIEVAFQVERGRTFVPNLPQALLLPRYPRRFAKLLDASESVPWAGVDVWRLRPEMAIADALMSHSRGFGMSRDGVGAWSSFSTDLDTDLVRDNIDEIVRSLASLGATDVEKDAFMVTLLGHEDSHRNRCP